MSTSASATTSITPAARCSCIATSRSRVFDRAFAAFWRMQHRGEPSAGPKRRDGASASIVEIEQVLAPGDARGIRSDAAEESEPAAEVGIKTWSDLGGLRDKDFAAFTRRRDRAGAHRARAAGVEPRRCAGRDAGCRAAARASTCGARSPTACAPAATSSRCRAGCGGVRPAAARPAVRRQRIDGPLLPHAAALRAHARVAQRRRVEVFLFSTRLTRITTELRMRAPGRGARGGVAVGAGLVRRHAHRRRAAKQFHQRWSRRVLDAAGRSCCSISDGWDRGDPEMLRDQIARLQRSCHRSDLAEPAHRHRRLRAADPRAAGSAAVRRRLPAGANADTISPTWRYT